MKFLVIFVLCLAFVVFTGCEIDVSVKETPSAEYVGEEAKQPTYTATPSAVTQEETSLPTTEKSTGFSRLDKLSSYDYGKPERYYSETMLGLVPGDSYGKIYPFVGQVNMSKFDFHLGNGYFYGFIDQDGKIICDPSYNDVRLLSYGEKSVYLLLKRTYDGDPYTEEVSEYYAVVGGDGSFIQKYEDVYNYSCDWGPQTNEYIPVKNSGKWGIIDYDGKEILPCVYPNAPLFMEGLAAVLDGEGSDVYNYININGEKVLGPFENPPFATEYYILENVRQTDNLETAMFYNDRAMYFENGKYGFIDKNGSRITPPLYTYTSYSTVGFKRGNTAVVCIMPDPDPEEPWMIDREHTENAFIDRDGNLKTPMMLGWMISSYYDSNYYVLQVFTETQMIERYFDKDGTEAPIGNLYMGGGYWNKAGNTDPANGDLTGVTVFGNGFRRVFDTEVQYIRWICGNIFEFYDENTQEYNFIDITGKLYSKGELFTGTVTGNEYGKNYKIFTKMISDKNGNLNKNLYGIMAENGVLFDADYNYLKEIGENFLAVKGNYGGLMDIRGNWIIKVSLLDSLND